MTSHVYIIEAQIGVIKIGCGNWPEGRVSTVRTHSPVPVRLLAKWPGGRAEERALHSRFGQYRTHSEWFRIDGELLGFLAEVRGRGLDTIETWEDVSYSSTDEKRARLSARRSATHRRNWSDPEYRLSQMVRMGVGRGLSLKFGQDWWRRPLSERADIDAERIALRSSILATEKARALLEELEARGVVFSEAA